MKSLSRATSSPIGNSTYSHKSVAFTSELSLGGLPKIGSFGLPSMEFWGISSQITSDGLSLMALIRAIGAGWVEEWLKIGSLTRPLRLVSGRALESPGFHPSMKSTISFLNLFNVVSSA